MQSKVADMEHISECFEKVAIADILLSLNQTQQEADAGDMRGYVMANRLGKSQVGIQMKVNWEMATIKETE